ncbi:chymotrypsin-like protease CTRL-1 [Chironomus tepperi]|uniref:chymotrypsin-like protease CTRL-1 n=1 Tax=Chironomus tepperi TaxID=113505 RepID=UPI00391FC30B
MKIKFLIFVLFVIFLDQSLGQDNCGIQKSFGSSTDRVISTFRGEHPWKAALVKDDGKFFCGGSLISNKAVVTAAQCINQKGDSNDLNPEQLSVVLGAHDLSKSYENGRVTVGVKSIHVHPDWNSDSDIYDGDVALLVLETEVQFSDTIQPVCLSTPQSTSSQKTEGIVAGYQKTEGVNHAKKLTVSIKSYRNCFRENRNLKSFLTSRSICGYSKANSEDFEAGSGSGFYVFDNNRFYLRGITSASSLNGKLESVKTYGIFADTLKYCGWIQSGGKDIYAQCTDNDFTTTTQKTTTTTQPTTTSQTTTQPTTTSKSWNFWSGRTTTEKPIKDTLIGGECLNAHEYIESKNKCFKVYYQVDGNFVNYRASFMQYTWHANTHNTCTKFACMQTDGNFVVYDCHGVARWASNTAGHPGARIIIQGDGNLVIYSPNDVPLWNSQTVTHC